MKTKLPLISLLAMSGALIAAPTPDKKAKVAPPVKPVPAVSTNAPAANTAVLNPMRLRQLFLQKWALINESDRATIQKLLEKY